MQPKAASAALFETYVRRSQGLHQPQEDEPLPCGKGKTLRSIRCKNSNCFLRLIYFQVKPAGGHKTPGQKALQAASPASDSPIRFVGLLAWKKKRNDVDGDTLDTAWKRSELWLTANPDYRRQ